MGHELRRMISLGAPEEWTPLMRLVAFEIADDARDPRDGDPPLPEGTWPWSKIPIEGLWRKGKWVSGLAERLGMSARAISRTLGDLAAAGYEMRKPVKDKNGCPVTDKRGRLLFTAPGHALEFHVPWLPLREVPRTPPDSAAREAQRWPEVASDGGQRSPEVASEVVLLPVDNPLRSPLLASVQPDRTPLRSPEVATVQPERSPEVATNQPDRSPEVATTVAESGDPIPSVSPHSLSPHKNQSPQETPDARGGAAILHARKADRTFCAVPSCEKFHHRHPSGLCLTHREPAAKDGSQVLDDAATAGAPDRRPDVDMRDRLKWLDQHGAYRDRAPTIGEHEARIQAYGQARAEGIWDAETTRRAIDDENKLWRRKARG